MFKRFMILMVLAGLFTGCTTFDEGIGELQTKELREIPSTPFQPVIRIGHVKTSVTEKLNDTSLVSSESYSIRFRLSLQDLITSGKLNIITLNGYDLQYSEKSTVCETSYLDNRTIEYCRPALEYYYKLKIDMLYKNKSAICISDFRDNNVKYLGLVLTEVERMQLEKINGSIEDFLLSRLALNFPIWDFSIGGNKERISWCQIKW